MRREAALIALAVVLLIVAVWLKASNYEECRAVGFTNWYCLTAR